MAICCKAAASRSNSSRPDPPGSSAAPGARHGGGTPRGHSRPPRDPDLARREPRGHRDPDQGDQPHRSPAPSAPPPLARGSPAHPGRASAGNRAPPAWSRRRHVPDAPAPPVRNAAPPPDSRRTRPAHRSTASIAQQAGARSGCTDLPALVVMPLVAVNQKDGGHHGAGNAGPRRGLWQRRPARAQRKPRLSASRAIPLRAAPEVPPVSTPWHPPGELQEQQD